MHGETMKINTICYILGFIPEKLPNLCVRLSYCLGSAGVKEWSCPFTVQDDVCARATVPSFFDNLNTKWSWVLSYNLRPFSLWGSVPGTHCTGIWAVTRSVM